MQTVLYFLLKESFKLYSVSNKTFFLATTLERALKQMNAQPFRRDTEEKL